MAAPVPPLRPSVGFCIQTESAGNPPAQWYVNMCKHKLVEMPLAYSGKVVSREHILTHGIGNMQVPFDVGSCRKLKARAEGAKQTTYCIDAVFNPLIVALFMDDEFCNAMSDFRPFVINLALRRIEESVGVKLQAQQVKLVKALRYKDGEDGDASLPRELTELASEQDSFDAEMPKAAKAPTPTPEPLIEDLTPAVKKKPVIKKGFLNKGNTDLYGPDGSREGVLPENAGDPMGWMPKGLRKTCKIVDTNAPEWQEHEKKKKAAEQTNSMNQEFRDTLANDMANWAKAAQPDKWQEDLPDGTEPPPATRKYEVDYSRFSKIADADEKPAVEERDWYCDAKGNVRQKERQAASPPAASATVVKPSQDSKSELQKSTPVDSGHPQQSVSPPAASATGVTPSRDSKPELQKSTPVDSGHPRQPASPPAASATATAVESSRESKSELQKSTHVDKPEMPYPECGNLHDMD